MALLDFLKRKEEIEKAKKPEKKTEKVLSVNPETKKLGKNVHPIKSAEGGVPPKAKQFNRAGFSYEVIKQPHISEKASYLAEKNQYTFEVSPNYNKKEIKNAVEGIYKVGVLSVNMIKIPAKRRRLGKTEGFRKAYRKAVVKIKEGQKIEIL